MNEHTGTIDKRTGIEPVSVPDRDQPNLPEVSGTSFPLLTTVLAGFAITIAVQLIIRPDAADELPLRVVAAIIVFLASTLLFITAIVFAVNAQAHNYLPFIEIGQQGRQVLNVTNAVEWIKAIQRRWELFHLASIFAFYAGILLLLAGVNLVVWAFVGNGVALIFFLFILVNVGAMMAINSWIYRNTNEDRVDSSMDRDEPELEQSESASQSAVQQVTGRKHDDETNSRSTRYV